MLLRVGKIQLKSGRHQRLVRRTLVDFLKDAEHSTGSTLSFHNEGDEIVVSATSTSHSLDREGATDSLRFEDALAGVLARRDSALKRLAE